MSSRPKIESVYDFTEKGLVELKAWLEPWFPSGGGGGEVEWADTGTGAGGGGGGSGIFFDVTPQEGGYLEVTANDTGGVNVLATGSGAGWDAGQMTLECNGGTTTLKNSDEGIVVYSTGHFAAGRITDLDATLLETGADRPGVIIGSSWGTVISSGAIEEHNEHGSLNLVFLYADTGHNLLRSPVLLATTSDPHIAGALWNSGGTVKISSG